MAAAARRLVPLFDRVLVERVAPQLKSAGGILLPESAQPKINEGVVIAVGPGMTHEHNGQAHTVPCVVKEGDTVMLPEFGGTTVTLQEKEYVLFREMELLGTFQ